MALFVIIRIVSYFLTFIQSVFFPANKKYQVIRFFATGGGGNTFSAKEGAFSCPESLKGDG